MMNNCMEHERTRNELEACKSKINMFEVLMKKIDEELKDIKATIDKLAEKIEILQQKTAEMPLSIITKAVIIGASVSTILTFLILFVSRISGVL